MSDLFPTITPEVREALIDVEVNPYEADPDFDQWWVEVYAERGQAHNPVHVEHNLVQWLQTRFQQDEYHFTYADGTSNAARMFFDDVDSLIDDIKPFAEVAAGDCDCVAQLYDFGEYVIELSDSGFGVYFK